MYTEQSTVLSYGRNSDGFGVNQDLLKVIWSTSESQDTLCHQDLLYEIRQLS